MSSALLRSSCIRRLLGKSAQKLLMQLFVQLAQQPHLQRESMIKKAADLMQSLTQACQAACDTNLSATRSFNYYWMQCDTDLLPNCCAPVVVIPTTWASLRMQRSSCSLSSVSLSAAAWYFCSYCRIFCRINP